MRTIKLRTYLDPAKGWGWELCTGRRRVATGRHHVPLEILAIRSGVRSAGGRLVRMAEEGASAEELIRADQWQAEAARLSAQASRFVPKEWPVPVRLDCGHVRMVRPRVQLGSDQVGCGPCRSHRTPIEWIDPGPSPATMEH